MLLYIISLQHVVSTFTSFNSDMKNLIWIRYKLLMFQYYSTYIFIDEDIFNHIQLWLYTHTFFLKYYLKMLNNYKSTLYNCFFLYLIAQSYDHCVRIDEADNKRCLRMISMQAILRYPMKYWNDGGIPRRRRQSVSRTCLGSRRTRARIDTRWSNAVTRGPRHEGEPIRRDPGRYTTTCALGAGIHVRRWATYIPGLISSCRSISVVKHPRPPPSPPTTTSCVSTRALKNQSPYKKGSLKGTA